MERSTAEIITPKDAKRFLQRIIWLKRRMESAALEAVHYREMATSITAAMDGDRVSSSGTHSRVESAALRILELAEQADRDAMELAWRVTQARLILGQLEDEREITVLRLRYFEQRSWTAIQTAMGYASPTSVYRLHGSALQHFAQAAQNV